MKNEGGTSIRAPGYSTGLEDKGVLRKKYKEEHVYSVALLVHMSGMHSWKTLRINSHYYCVHWGTQGFTNTGVATT